MGFNPWYKWHRKIMSAVSSDDNNAPSLVHIRITLPDDFFNTWSNSKFCIIITELPGLYEDNIAISDSDDHPNKRCIWPECNTQWVAI